MNSLKAKIASSQEFWTAVERIYGEVPGLIKLVLQVNGFNSFLALKGIRYDDKQEFFGSLESTVVECLSSEIESDEKKELEAELAANYQSVKTFKLKPGHRNYIMNLMQEIEKADVSEFFGKCSFEPPETLSPRKQYTFETVQVQNTSNRLVVRRPNEKAIILKPDHEYSREETELDETQYFVEEYLTDDTMDSTGVTRIVEYDSTAGPRPAKRKSTQATPDVRRRKPDHMYNDEFMAKCTNPRRRRVTLNKNYPMNDEGTRERFVDLIQQSLECILPNNKLLELEYSEILVEKESESSWAVYCPLCHSRIRLPVVYENGGRYCNYKRSNFERHLRFKHCKNTKQKEEYFEEVEMVEEIVESN